MLIATRAEVDAVAALLEQGAESPAELAKAVIKLVGELRSTRQHFVSVFELSPGIYQAYGPYATRAAAEKGVAKIPLAQIAKRGALVPVIGPNVAVDQLTAADEQTPDRGDFVICREDAKAFRRGWKGKQANRKDFVGT